MKRLTKILITALFALDSMLLTTNALPSSPQCNENIAEIQSRAGELSNQGKWAEAVRDYQRLLKLDPQNRAEYMHQIAYLYEAIAPYHNANANKAIQWCKKLLELNPKDAEAMRRLGSVYHRRRNRHDLALKWYRKAMKTNPDNPWTYQDLASLYFQRKDYENALKYLRKAIEVDPSNEGNLCDYIAQIYIAKKDTQNAIKWYYRAIELGSFTHWPSYKLAKIYKETGDPEKGLKVMQDCIKKNPKNAYGYEYLGYFCMEAKKFEEAIQAFKRMIELDPNIIDYYPSRDLNEAFKEAKMYDEAIEFWQKLTENYPENFQLFLGLVSACQQAGRYNEAIDLLKQRLTKHEYNEELFLRLASAYQQAGRHNEAIDLLKQRLTKHEYNEELFLRLVSAYQQAGSYNEAIDLLKQQLTKHEYSEELWGHLMRLYYSTEKWDEAYELAYAALQKEPPNPKPAIALTKVWATFKPNEIIKLLEVTTEKFPRDIQAHLWATKCYLKTNRKLEQAEKHFRRVIQLAHGPENDFIRWDAYLLLGQTFVKNKRFDEAISLYERAIAKMRYHLKQLWYWAEKYDQIAAELAKLYLNRGQKTKAIEVLEVALTVTKEFGRASQHMLNELKIKRQ